MGLLYLRKTGKQKKEVEWWTVTLAQPVEWADKLTQFSDTKNIIEADINIKTTYISPDDIKTSPRNNIEIKTTHEILSTTSTPHEIMLTSKPPMTRGNKYWSLI